MSNFLRIVEVMKKTGIAKSTIWLWVKEGKFSKPLKLSQRITVWEEEKIIKGKHELLNNNKRII